MKIHPLIGAFFYFLIAVGCKENKDCNLDIGPVNNREEAETRLKSNTYSYSDSFIVRNPDFVKQVFYYSCDNKKGFLLYKSKYNGEYFFNKVTREDWLSCKVVNDCDSFMENYISKRYLSYERKEVFINDTIK